MFEPPEASFTMKSSGMGKFFWCILGLLFFIRYIHEFLQRYQIKLSE
jgi:hypothetical protein